MRKELVNPNYEGNSVLILTLFGNGLEKEGENRGLLHRQLVGHAKRCGLSWYDAEDTVQDFYLDVSRKAGAPGYSLEFELNENLDVNTHSGFRRLVWGSFGNYLISQNRKREVRAEKDVTDFSSPYEANGILGVIGAESPEQDVLKAERLEELEVERRGLNPQTQEVLRLYYEKDLSFPEIAAQLEMPEGTVRSKWHRGIVSLRRRLQPAA